MNFVKEASIHHSRKVILWEHAHLPTSNAVLALKTKNNKSGQTDESDHNERFVGCVALNIYSVGDFVTTAMAC
ncbi:hypothetical protein CHUAL_004042 [Chamberlinius hualienensis]